jgi:hypothetical protein
MMQGSIDFGGGAISATKGKLVLVRLAADGSHLFSRAYGPDSNLNAFNAIVFDADGNLIASGIVNKPSVIDFGGGVVAGATDQSGVWLAKWNPQMVATWARLITTPAGQAVQSTELAVDAQGNVLLPGSFEGHIDFGDGPVDGNPNLFFAKYRPDGSFLSKKTFGFIADTASCNILASIKGSVAGDGSVVLLGYASARGTLDLGGGAISLQPSWCDPGGGAKYLFARYEP